MLATLGPSFLQGNTEHESNTSRAKIKLGLGLRGVVCDV